MEAVTANDKEAFNKSKTSTISVTVDVARTELRKIRYAYTQSINLRMGRES